MIIYFADRHLNILGQASTSLPKGITITGDLKTDDVETGVSIFECDILFDKKTRADVEAWAEVGNYILRSSDGEYEVYNIIDAESDTKKKKVSIYAEDDGLDLLNEVVEAYEADQNYPISYYVEKYVAGAGWEIGINEVEGLTKKLKWDSEQTASARLLSIAESFNNCEISFSFNISGLKITKKYINIFEKRGKDTGIQLRLNKEIDSIITTKSISNLATALQCTGSTADDSEEPVTLKGYVYDDGDFYVDGAVLKSRKALEKWSRYLWRDDNSQQSGGHVVKQYSFDTLSQEVLCQNAIAELKAICDMEVNYDVDITEFPESLKVGDRVNLVDDEGELYLSSRVLILETSVVGQSRRAIFGEHLIRKNGISDKVAQLAAEFAKQTVSVKRAQAIANSAKTDAANALTKAESVKGEAEEAKQIANDAKTSIDGAVSSASSALAEAQAAKAAIDKVENSVASLESTITNAKAAADNAALAAEIADTKAEEAKTAANNAEIAAAAASVAANEAKASSVDAVNKANTAKATADKAKSDAAESIATALAAKEDAKQAERDIEAFAENLDKLESTMIAEYSRKTDLTEATADLQTQITRNAAGIESTAHKLVTVDETANNALSKAEAAQKAAALAQEQADIAAAEAAETQAAANRARAEANAAQNQADIAKAAAETARSVANQAKADLEAAEADLATVQSRADATEEEIAAAQLAVENALENFDAANIDFSDAIATAKNAQNVANTAVAEAVKAEAAANDAAYKAELAQTIADEAKGNAEAVKATADEAAAIAAEAQERAATAKAIADEAQAIADEAAEAALNAQKNSDELAAVLENADAILADAEERLAEVLANVNSTTEEVQAAYADVAAAQASADEAETAAEEAQASADAARADAETAQAAADTAKAAADEAQAEAKEAQDIADVALGLAHSLEKRITETETKITQNADSLKLTASKKEVADAIDDTKDRIEKAESSITILADMIQNLVSDETGQSLMTQTPNGWTFDISKLRSAADDALKQADDLLKNIDKTSAALDEVEKTVKGINGLSEYVRISTYEYVDENGVTKIEPCLELGEADSDFKRKITNTQDIYLFGRMLKTYIDKDGVTAENVKVTNSLMQSGIVEVTDDGEDTYTSEFNFEWKIRTNGNYGLGFYGWNP